MVEQATRKVVLSDLSLALVRVTEEAAIAAAEYMGKGDKEAVDGAAVDAMRYRLQRMSIHGVVVIGEGEKDEAPMLYNSEQVGRASELPVDIAVDPIDGTTLMSKGLPGAISVIALSLRGTMHVPTEVFYMDKIAVGPEARDVIDINAPVAENVRRIAHAVGKSIAEVTVVMLDRPRHADLVAQVRASGARIKMVSDGDVAAGIQAALPGHGVDVLMGIGGTPEGVIAAAALRCTGGAIQCKPWPRDEAERQKCREAGLDLNHVYTTEELVGGDDVLFSATGATTGEMLRGVRVDPGSARTNSLVMDSLTGTIQWIDTAHDFKRLREAGLSRS
jgi:fructose-1,6-bisphosphatase II